MVSAGEFILVHWESSATGCLFCWAGCSIYVLGHLCRSQWDGVGVISYSGSLEAVADRLLATDESPFWGDALWASLFVAGFVSLGNGALADDQMIFELFHFFCVVKLIISF